MKLKDKIKKGEVTVGGWLTVGHVQVVEAQLSANVYDWVVIDLEHSEISYEQSVQIFAICERYNVAPLARLSSHDPIEGRKMLDLGAQGLLIPVVEDAEKLSETCKHFFYPPKGTRGVCLSRMNAWGKDFDSYIKNFDPILIPQIETVKGAKNADAICKLPFVDAVFIGPYDLSASLGTPGDFTTSSFAEHARMIKTAADANKKSLGIHVVEPEPENLKKKISEGYKFIGYGTDLICLRHSLKGVQTRD